MINIIIRLLFLTVINNGLIFNASRPLINRVWTVLVLRREINPGMKFLDHIYNQVLADSTRE